MFNKNPNNILEHLLILLILKPLNIIKLRDQIPISNQHSILPQFQPNIPQLIQQTLLNIIEEEQLALMDLFGGFVQF